MREAAKLMKAVKNNDISKVRSLLGRASNKQINNRTFFKDETPLEVASREGYEEIVKLLLEKGVEVDQADASGITPLRFASQEGHEKVVELLLRNGAKVDQANNNGATPLYMASYEGHEKVVEQLLQYRANVDQADATGTTPLWFASQEGHEKVVELLLRNGAKVDLADNDGNTPLWAASYKGHEKMVELLLSKGAKVDLADNDGNTPLWTAAREGHEKVMELLLSKGANVDQADMNGTTLLGDACEYGHLNRVNFLLTAGADVNEPINNDIEIEESLEQAEATSKETPLYLASQSGHLDIVKVLVKAGADINSGNGNGASPLYMASQSGNSDVVNYLCEKGADINQQNNVLGSPLFIALLKGHEKVVELLLSKGADVDLADNDGSTPLLIASERGHEKVVEQLLKHGANVDQADKNGSTPLHRASRYGHEKVVEQLLKHGANVNQVDSDGETPLSIALAIALENSDEKIVNLLKNEAAKRRREKARKEQEDEIVDAYVSISISFASLTLGKELGRGGFGVVYEGEWQHGKVAIKQLINRNITPKALDEFKNEVSIMAGINHSNIVQCYGACFEAGRYSIVMEYMPKGSLCDVLHSSQSLPWKVRYSIAMDITSGLSVLHARNILHRDLKSLNVLLDDHMRAKLTDFGLSKIKTETQSQSVAQQSQGGTVVWKAPELFKRGFKATKASDVYSYGMILWELTSRKFPYAGDVAPQIHIMNGITEEVPKACEQKYPSFTALIKHCWAKNIEDRPTIDEAAEQLKSHPIDSMDEDETMSSDTSESDEVSYEESEYSQEKARKEREEKARKEREEKAQKEQAEKARKEQEAKELLKKQMTVDSTLELNYKDIQFGKEINEGSFGKIYSGHYKKQAVAIKTVSGEMLERDRREFIREVKIMGKLRSKYIVQFIGVSLHEKDKTCYVMEYMQNDSLCQALTQEEFTAKQRHQIALEIAQGLQYLHEEDIVHADVKSANVLLNEDWHAKLADFGLSKITDSMITEIQEQSKAVRWLAPEVIQGNGKPSKQADIYGYGMVLWELFTGHHPFEEYSDEEVIQKVLKGEREAIPDDMPKIYAEIIQSCWSSDPQARLGLDEIIDAIEEYEPIDEKALKEAEEMKYREQGLIESVKQGDVKAIAYLLTQANTDINDVDEEEKTALHHAVLGKHTEIIELLLENPALDVDQASMEGRTALHYAAQIGEIGLIKKIVSKGADLFIQDELDLTAREIAKEGKYIAIAGYLRKQEGSMSSDIGGSAERRGSDARSNSPRSSQRKSREANRAGQDVNGRRSSSGRFSSKLPRKSSGSRATKPLIDSTGGMHISLAIPYNDLQFGAELGSGGFGIVYRGTWRHTDVAIKQLHAKKLSENSLDEFRNETGIMATIRHPGVVQLYGACFENGRYSLVMEYMPKGSLYEVLHNSNQELPWTLRYSIAMDITSGLSVLHATNILHRDLKSLNILLDDRMRAKLTDFGLSKVRQETRSTSGQDEGAAGTLPWMAPELLKRRAKYTQKADIYSYGMILWEIASRETPFADAHTQGILRGWIEKGDQEEIPKECEQQNPKYASLIRWCWSFKSEERPSIEEAARQLKAYPITDEGEENSETEAPQSAEYESDEDESTPQYQNNLASIFPSR